MTPLTDKIYLLEKFSGKGGWTFVRLPEIPPPEYAVWVGKSTWNNRPLRD